ncbi:MAG TPA: YdcF family protein [Cytophagaceae bacterium]
MKQLFKLVFILFLIWYVIHTLLIITDGLKDERYKADVAIILGNTVNADGSLSGRLKSRLDKGIELYNDSLVSLIVVSGGLGKEGHYEGTKMMEYLVKNKIPKEKIIVDDLGNTTRATARNVKAMNLQLERILVISQYYHITRTKLAFRKEGFQKVYGVHANYFEWRDFYSIFREFFGYYKYWLF